MPRPTGYPSRSDKGYLTQGRQGRVKKKEVRMKKIFRFLLGLPYQYPEDNNHKTIAILIPAYNEEKTIADTIQSLKNQTRLPDEILVVDDCSQDRTGEIAKNLGAKVIRLEKNSGTKSQAQNAGLPHIKSDITITIDADTTLHSEAIENIVKPLADPNVASVCGLVVPQRIESIWEKARFIEYLYGISIMKGAQVNLGMALVSSGCFSAFRTRELQKKGFKKRTLAEDMDLSWEFLIEGRRITYVGKAICFPLDPPNYRIYKQQLNRWYRSFFQNIAVHKRDIFKRKVLAFFVGWYLIENTLAPAAVFLFPFFLLRGNPSISLMFLANWVLITVASIWCAHRIQKKLLALRSLPCYFLISFVNMILFWLALVREWIIRDTLKVWAKGH